MMLKLVKPLRNGQITIPIAMRQKLGIKEETLLQLRLLNKEIRLTPVKISQAVSGSPWLSELYDLFSQIRKKGERYPPKEIDKDIKKAIKALRRK